MKPISKCNIRCNNGISYFRDISQYSLHSFINYENLSYSQFNELRSLSREPSDMWTARFLRRNTGMHAWRVSLNHCNKRLKISSKSKRREEYARNEATTSVIEQILGRL